MLSENRGHFLIKMIFEALIWRSHSWMFCGIKQHDFEIMNRLAFFAQLL